MNIIRWHGHTLIVSEFLLASVLQADEYILIVFHDLTEDLEAVVEPDFLSDLTSLNLSKHFVVFGDVHVLLYWSSLLAIVVKSDPGMDEPVREGLSKRLSALDRVKLMLGNATVLIGDSNNYDVWLGGGHTLLYWCSLPATVHRLNEDDKSDANDDTDKGSEDLFHTLLYQSSFFLRPGFFFAGSALTFSNTSLPSSIAFTLFFTCLRTGFSTVTLSVI